jgi:hypothetical protein
MRKYSIIFNVALAGIVLCLGMTVYSAVSESRQKAQDVPTSIPVPAY